MKIRWFIIIIILLALALALAGGFTMLWRFFVFLVVLVFFSYLWLRLNSRRLDGRVEKLPRYCRVGEYFEEEITFENRSRMPTALITVQEDTDLPGGDNKVTFSLPSKGSYSWRSRLLCKYRGRYSVGNLTARITDSLGFFSIQQHFGWGQSIIVFPATLEVPFFQALPHQEPGSNPRHWFASESGPNASRVREYTSGDSLRHIHWHTTAHTGNLMVKEFDPDHVRYTFKDVWIVLDMYRLSQYGTGNETTEEYSITIAASLAKKYLETGKKVGLLASGDRSYLLLPETGEEHLQSVMRDLSVIRATGEIPIDALLVSQEQRFEEGSAVIVITPSDMRSKVASLRRIANRGCIVTAILLDAMSFGGKAGTVEAARSLVAGGTHVYIVRRGANIARALDSRFVSSPLQSTGVKNRSDW